MTKKKQQTETEIIDVKGSRDATRLLQAVSDPRFEMPDAFYKEGPRKVWEIVQKMLSGEWKGPNDRPASASAIRRMMGVLLEMDAVNRGKHRNGVPSIDDDSEAVTQIRADVDLKVAVSLVSELPETERELLSKAAELMDRLQQQAIENEGANIEQKTEG